MKLKIYFSLILSVAFFPGFAQKHDNVWIMGYYGQNPHPSLGGMKFDFTSEPPSIEAENTNINFRGTNISISDENGVLSFVSNGVNVYNFQFDVVENGDSLNPSDATFPFYDSGLNITQGTLAIPVPDSVNKYFVFHEPFEWNPEITTHFPKLLYSTVDMSANNGAGKLIEKNEILIVDTLVSGKLTAVKHGNGRDWWVFTAERAIQTNSFYPILVTPDGMELQEKQTTGPGLIYEESAIGQAVFSPDGTKYIRHDVRFEPFSTIDIYDFDRCTGQLTHVENFEIHDTTGLAGGVSVSPDSRYLYIITRVRVYQFDLLALNIYATRDTVLEYDGHIAITFPSTFFNSQLAPNGKIYFACAATDTVMHIIHTPNQSGLKCNPAQHAIALPKLNGRTIPNFPNYRLGPLDGSPCDTLGLDNFPMAGFSHHAEGLTVYFSDNSYYRPEAWDWDFGDSQGSAERNPVHEYELPGEYEVCLTVSNENGEDTFCRWVQVDSLPPIVSAVENLPSASVHLWPNPASNQLKIKLLGMTGTGGHSLKLYDMAGRKVRSWDLAAGQTEGVFWLGGVADGLYVWGLSGADGRRLSVGKLMVKN